MERQTENDLIRLYQTGNPEQQSIASNKLWKANIKWIRNYVKSWLKGKRGISFNELLGEACIGFMLALSSFDIHHKNNPRLISHAAIWIRGTFIRYVREHIHAGYTVPRCSAETRNMIKDLRSNRLSLSQKSVTNIAQRFDMPENRVRELEMFFFNKKHTAIEESECLVTHSKNCAKHDDEILQVKNFICAFVNQQPESLANILRKRWLNDKKVSYKKLADDFAISYEQVRQVEIRAFSKLRRQLEANQLI